MPNELDHDVAIDDQSVEPGVWRYAKATRATVLIDAENYFTHMQQAMLGARKRILMIGWDFDTRIHLEQGRRWYQKGWRRTYPSRLGSFILWLNRHRDGLEVRILKWSFGAFKFFSRGSMMLDLIRWWPHRRIDFKFDTSHPIGASHHQKIVVIDDHVAVCGGIDMTTQRWDTREHLEDDPRRKRPRGSEYGPWHDATMMIEGEASAALGDLGRDRWARANGPPLEPVSNFESEDQSAWPEELEAQFENVELGIARTRGEFGGQRKIDEIAELFERQIASAKEYIYAESQYFTSRRIADAIGKRLAEENPPEILIVHAEHAEGWLEQQAMDHARSELIRTLGHLDNGNRFGLYVPFTGETPIYVHAKIMIIDDSILRIGSANMNNRSMGLDSECDIFVDCDRPGNDHCRAEVARLRHSLLAEHCGLEIDEVAGLLDQHGSMAKMIEEIGAGRSRTLRRFDLPELNTFQEAVATSGLLDPETHEETFEPYAHGGLFRRGSQLGKARDGLMKRKS